MMGGALSITHWLIVLAVVLLLFGTGKLRNAGKDLGEGLRGLKDGVRDANDVKQDLKQVGREVEH